MAQQPPAWAFVEYVVYLDAIEVAAADPEHLFVGEALGIELPFDYSEL